MRTAPPVGRQRRLPPCVRILTASLLVISLQLNAGGASAASATSAAASGRAPPAPQSKKSPAKPSQKQPTMTMDQFLDRLMIAESSGNDHARNARSTATGPFQFIESTFLSVMQRHFPERIAKLTPSQILALRTDRQVARAAARAYTRDNATLLAAAGHRPTFAHLRLAYLFGAGGAKRILDAAPKTPLRRLLHPAVIRANPWMARHTVRSVIARAARDILLSPSSLAGAKPFRDPVTGKLITPRHATRRPRIKVRCNLARPSCKRWLSLKRHRLRAAARRKPLSRHHKKK